MPKVRNRTRTRVRRARTIGIPIGQNTLSSKNLFRERRRYQDRHRKKKNTIDFWYDRTLYGRIDAAGNAVYPSEANLKPIMDSDCLFALNFVVDAYGGFLDEFSFRNQANPKFRNDRVLSPRALAPQAAWLSINKLYHQHMEGVNESFVGGYLQNNNRHLEVETFDQFMDHFIDFLDLVATNSPFTRSGIITGLACPANVSGLCIELSSEDPSVDRTKEFDFYKNDFYYSFRRAAQNHGFMIDKNVPWKLVANINSKKMQKYMKRYNINPENLFDEYYYKSYVFDVPSIKVYLREFYTSFLSSIPGTRRTSRSRSDEAKFGRKYDGGYWIQAYAKIRQSEVLDKLNKVQFDKLARDTVILQKKFGMSSAAWHVNKQFLGQLTPTV